MGFESQCKMWLVAILLFLAAHLPASLSDANISGLKCLANAATASGCNGGGIPERLFDLYSKLNKNSKTQLKTGHLQAMSPQDIVELPKALIYLLPPGYMKTMSGMGLARMLQTHRQDSALAVQIIEGLQTTQQRAQFFDELIGTELPTLTQHLLGEALAVWRPDMMGDWAFDTFHKTLRNGSPLMAYLPPSKLTPLKNKLAVKFLHHLRSWHRTSLRPWDRNSKIVKRVWAELVIRGPYSKWEMEDVTGYEFLLVGATADEINLLSGSKISPKIFFQSMYDKLQVRAMFNLLHISENLTTSNFTEVLPVALQLAPRHLQQFNPNATDFRLLKSVTPDLRQSSFTTDKQILESLIAQSVLAGRLRSENPDSWLDDIKELGRFVYVLSSDILKVYSKMPLRSQVLNSIDSENLTRRQAWLLTGEGTSINLQKPSSVLGLQGLLKAIPTKTLVKHRIGDLAQNVLSHLAVYLPDFEPAMSAAVLHKLRPQLGERSVLENLLSNKQTNQFFDLLSPREVKSLSREILASFKNMHNIGFRQRIKSLPQRFLSVLLLSTRAGRNWTSDDLLQNLAFLGLTCKVIDEIDVTDTINIISNFTSELRNVHKTFPKNIQYCSQNLVSRYLTMKSYLHQADANQNILNMLNAAEIQAIGGYILSSYPADLIKDSMNRTLILKAVGQQSLPMLMESSGKKDQLFRYSRFIMVDLLGRGSMLGIDQLLNLGSLIHFLPPLHSIVIEPSAFKLFVESLEEKRSKTVCSDQNTREEWYKLIVSAFGSPNEWTASTLGILGDFLLVVPSDVLDSVPARQWSDAIDLLVEQTSYHLQLSWPNMEEPVSFVKACSTMLQPAEQQGYQDAVRALLRRYLIASQNQLDTIATASQLLASVRMFEENQHKVRVVPDLQIDRPEAKIEILEPKDISSEKPPSKDEETRAIVKESDATEETEPPAMDLTTVQPSIVLLQEQINLGMIMNRTEDVITMTELTMEDNNEENNGEVTNIIVSTTKRPVEVSTENLLEVSVITTSISREEVVNDLLPAATNLHSISKRQLQSKDNQTKDRVKIQNSNLGHMENKNRTRKKITCDAIRALGKSASLALERRDIELMPSLELENCLEVLGSLDLDHDMYMLIWKLVNREVLLSNLMNLGHIVQALEFQDVQRIDLNLNKNNTLDVLALLGREVKHTRVLESIADQIELQNQDASSIGPAATIALGRIACEIQTHNLWRMVDLSFLHAASVLGRVSDCPTNCLAELVRLAVQDNAFGSPSTWSAEDLDSLEVIPAGLLGHEWQLVNAPELAGLKPSAVKCIPARVFKELTAEQLSHLSPLAASMVTSEQMELLKPNQKTALTRVRNLQPIVEVVPNDTIVVVSSAAIPFGDSFKGSILLMKYLHFGILVCLYRNIITYLLLHV